MLKSVRPAVPKKACPRGGHMGASNCFHWQFHLENIMSNFEVWEPVLIHYESLAPQMWLDYSVVNYRAVECCNACGI
jgi:hypothetical protein